MAKSFSTFVKRFTQIVAAFGLTAALSVSSFGASATWTGSTNQNWGTTYTANWSPNTTVGSADTATFGSSSQYSVTLSNATVSNYYTVKAMSFTGAATQGYTFTATAPGQLLQIGTNGVSNFNTAGTVTLPAVKLAGAGQRTWTGDTASTLTVSSLDLAKQSLTFNGGDSTIQSLSNTGSGGGNVLSVQSGTLTVQAGSAPAGLEATGGVLSLGSTVATSSTYLSVSGGGLYDNGGVSRTFGPNVNTGDAMFMDDGELKLASTSDVLTLSGGNYTQVGGQLDMTVASLSSYSKVVTSGTATFSNDLTGSSSLNLNLSSLGSVSQGDSWQLFAASSYSGQVDGTGNYNSFLSTNTTSGLYVGLAWIQDGQEWKSSTFGTGEYFVFTSQNGKLSVVPEPSTYAMGAIGLATAGFMRWRSRRRPVVA